MEKTLFKVWIIEIGFGITQACKDYLYPLIAGEAYPPYQDNGLPDYVTLQLPSAPRQLPDFTL